ncbi:hypothetical protein Aperf_G00000027746 [Anoplocephala perfoliata]
MCPSVVDCEMVRPALNASRNLEMGDTCKIEPGGWKYTLNKQVSIRLLMSRREAGCIIGKNGETISFLRKRSGAKIKVSDKGVKERIVSIFGSISAVLRVIKLFCREFAWISTEYVALEKISNIPKFIFRILLPASLCGSLIGQQGESIHKLRKITGSLLKLTRQKLPNSTDRILFIYGTVTAITACLEIICALVGEMKGRSHEIPYIPSSESVNPLNLCSNVPLFPWNMKFTTSMLTRSWIFPNRRRKCTQSQEQNTLNKIMVSNCGCDCNAQPCLFPPEAKDPGAAMKLSLLPSSAVSPSPLLSTSQIHSSVAFPGNSTSLLSSILLAASHLEVRRDMLIANDLVGCVIGRGGMKINEIRKASQATIRISNDENLQYCTRLITITGSPSAVDLAIGMINASLQCREAILMPSEITQPIY